MPLLRNLAPSFWCQNGQMVTVPNRLSLSRFHQAEPDPWSPQLA